MLRAAGSLARTDCSRVGHLPVEGHLGPSQFGDLTKDDAGVRVPRRLCDLLWDKRPGVQLAGHTIANVQFFKKRPNCFAEELCRFHVPASQHFNFNT